MSVQRLLEQLLVQVVTDETDRSAENEQTVQSTALEVFGSLFLGECTAPAEQVAERGGDSAIDVENEGVGLLGGDILNGKGKVERLVVREVLLDKVNDKHNSEIGVGLGLDLVADTRDKSVGFSHRVDKFSRGVTRSKTS